MTSKSSIQVPDIAPRLYSAFAEAVKPRALTTVSQWADRHRILVSESSSEPGRWMTDRAPYLREIMDSLSATSPTQRVVVMKATQIGGTEILLNWIGYVMHHNPAPMLLVVPTDKVLDKWSDQRLEPMLAASPALREVMGKRRSRDNTDKKEVKSFPGGRLILVGANSPSNLSSMPIKFIGFDEVDDYPFDAGGQGDVIGLAEERTKTFPRRKILLISSPKKPKGLSIIEQEYNDSDRRQFFVPCPHCGEMQVLRWRHDDGNYGLIHSEATGRVFYACRANGCEIDEHHKPDMLKDGRWIAANPEKTTRGYHINGLYAPLGLGYSWREMWDEWKAVQGDTTRLKRFINTNVAETWEEQGESIEGVALMLRLEDYAPGLKFSVITAGVDVQKDRLEISIFGWGEGEEAWALDHIIIDGDTATSEPWNDLEHTLSDAGVQFAAIDSGYNTGQVYAFVEMRRWCVAVKGNFGMGRPLIEDERKRKQRLRTRRRKGAAPEPLGVDQGKAIIYARLKQTQPGPGYIHFKRDPAFDDEYFNQIAAEKLVTKTRGGRPYQEWVQTRPRNEALDCAVYALAALRLSGRAIRAPVENNPKQPTEHEQQQEPQPFDLHELIRQRKEQKNHVRRTR